MRTDYGQKPWHKSPKETADLEPLTAWNSSFRHLWSICSFKRQAVEQYLLWYQKLYSQCRKLLLQNKIIFEIQALRWACFVILSHFPPLLPLPLLFWGNLKKMYKACPQKVVMQENRSFAKGFWLWFNIWIPLCKGEGQELAVGTAQHILTEAYGAPCLCL